MSSTIYRNDFDKFLQHCLRRVGHKNMTSDLFHVESSQFAIHFTRIIIIYRLVTHEPCRVHYLE
jgi:hypothetical protein